MVGILWGLISVAWFAAAVIVQARGASPWLVGFAFVACVVTFLRGVSDGVTGGGKEEETA
ncbi:unnamed protein product [marine sediment metagenome]|uniref:Uncharacterized protein n=1 Tax=marine sediment metagenome TaxID=412755 RepID=X1KGC2_9ZZZZ